VPREIAAAGASAGACVKECAVSGGGGGDACGGATRRRAVAQQRACECSSVRVSAAATACECFTLWIR
jgi:hypothetical protein